VANQARALRKVRATLTPDTWRKDDQCVMLEGKLHQGCLLNHYWEAEKEEYGHNVNQEYSALSAVVSRRFRYPVFVQDYNDAPDTTFHDIITLLDEAIVEYEKE
jgi:hypothetical protein